MSKVIVTGGAGFLGSHLCDALIKKGDEVLCIDNLSTGSLENVEHLQNNLNFKFLEYDVVKKLPDNLEADQIYHFASPASPNHHSKKSYQHLPFETMQVNTTATWNLSEFALAKNAKFLFASTSEVYGDPKEHPQSENYYGNVSPVGPRSVYDEAKRFGETITAAFVRSKHLDARIIRVFNTYGERMALDDGRAIVEFAVAALKNEPIPIFGDGSQTRSFCYVSDLIEGIILAMDHENTSGNVFNLGNSEEHTIREVAEKIKQLTMSHSLIEQKESLPEDDPQKRKPDISKAKEVLGWEPKVSLDTGLLKLIDYVRLELKSAS
ncbi:GDP-mannose 4,6-dehydratase [Candidatus Daviesbacteria bacterium]|nr:GDP-mannose 4,6-dehydratase [Candidatus Daviesbacteria bacterium]